jgi:hypothetical protein
VDTSLFDGIKSGIRRTGLILAVTIMAASLIIYLGWEGQRIELQFIHVTIGALAIVLAWALAVVYIHRRG